MRLICSECGVQIWVHKVALVVDGCSDYADECRCIGPRTGINGPSFEFGHLLYLLIIWYLWLTRRRSRERWSPS